MQMFSQEQVDAFGSQKEVTIIKQRCLCFKHGLNYQFSIHHFPRKKASLKAYQPLVSLN